MSEPTIRYIRHSDMYKPESPLHATYCMVEYYYYADAKEEVERLKAEVERLEGLVKYWQIEAETDHANWVRHAETNERLRKAGDVMLDGWIGMYGDHKGSMAEEYIQLWNNAKNGEQSA